MNKTLGFELCFYGVLLAALSLHASYLAPAMARPTLLTGLAGGALCLVWGLRAVWGSRGKTWPVLTLLPINFVLMSQAVIAWRAGSGEVPGSRLAALVITILFLCSFGMLLMIACAGVSMEGSPASARQEDRVKAPPAV